ncbi:MAG: glutamate---cysteine ligase / carboxylate-amine ligase [Abditibacteriota bacterium]|nr:glutamate---cysteine ligase / carboxylate-amine ligase [Abditibacteriota bacterium]
MGVEEEYQIVDPQTRQLRRGGHVVASAQQEVGQEATSELFQSQIEIGTPICATLGDVRDEIKRLRSAVIEAALTNDVAIVAAGTHPFSSPHDQQVTPKERYLGLAEDFGILGREHFICGCHVHIGINDREAAIQILNRARGWLAPLLAISSNSPFWVGEDTGYNSYRTEVWRRWPMAGSPHPFGNRAEYDALVRTLVGTGAISDETKIYWDMRPADRFETLEFRVADIGLSVDDAVLIAGLCRAIARTCWNDWCRDCERQAMFVPVRPELLRASEWRAARYGLDDELLDVHAGETVPAAELVQRLLNWLRPTLEEFGDWAEIEELAAKVLRDGNGAHRQREVWRRTGKLEAVVDFLIAETKSF